MRQITAQLGADDFTIKEETVQHDLDFIVVTKKNSEITGQSLRYAGLDDFVYFRQEPYADRYSLGVFGVRSMAEALAEQAGEKGFPAEVF